MSKKKATVEQLLLLKDVTTLINKTSEDLMTLLFHHFPDIEVDDSHYLAKAAVALVESEQFAERMKIRVMGIWGKSKPMNRGK